MICLCFFRIFLKTAVQLYLLTILALFVAALALEVFAFTGEDSYPAFSYNTLARSVLGSLQLFFTEAWPVIMFQWAHNTTTARSLAFHFPIACIMQLLILRIFTVVYVQELIKDLDGDI